MNTNKILGFLLISAPLSLFSLGMRQKEDPNASMHELPSKKQFYVFFQFTMENFVILILLKLEKLI